jgi:endonuclease/exonuclease/phosphatase family metal-dependent hydrolase
MPDRRLAARRRELEEERETLRRESLEAALPYLSIVRAPSVPHPSRTFGNELVVATYNVHRWTGLNGRRAPDPARASFVISELGADVVALQEVLRPFDRDDPLERLAEALHLHLAFVATRVHRQGELGNAILSRWPITSVFTLDLSFSRLERRSAVVAQFQASGSSVAVVSTHLALVDRTRRLQVRSILEHPQLQGPVVLLGDMNAWRRCKATRELDRELDVHHNREWPATFPAARPMLALDRIYTRGAKVLALDAHATAAARRASDHLPILARIQLDDR